MKYCIVIAACLLKINLSYSQTLIVPGSQLINYKLLRNQTLNYKLQLLTNNDEIKSEMKMRKTQVVMPKTKQICVVQEFDGMGEKIVDSTFAHFNTLLPQRMSMTSDRKGQVMRLTFNGKNIHAFSKRKEPITDTIHVIEEPYFDSNLMDCLIGAIRFEKDSVFKIHFYTFERNGKDTYFIKRIGEEPLTWNGKEVNTWHITLQDEKGNTMGNRPYDYWIDKSRGVLLKQELVLTARGKTRIILSE